VGFKNIGVSSLDGPSALRTNAWHKVWLMLNGGPWSWLPDFSFRFTYAAK
jgi:hypothetical protein